MSEGLRDKSKIGADWMERMAVVIAAASCVALSAGVIAASIYLLLTLASLLAGRPSFPE